MWQEFAANLPTHADQSAFWNVYSFLEGFILGLSDMNRHTTSWRFQMSSQTSLMSLGDPESRGLDDSVIKDIAQATPESGLPGSMAVATLSLWRRLSNNEMGIRRMSLG